MKNKKLFTTALIVLLISPFVAAYDEGDIISKETFSQVDTDKINLECRGFPFEVQFFPLRIVAIAGCLSAEEYDNENIQIVIKIVQYPILVFGNGGLWDCNQQGNTYRACWLNVFKPLVLEKIQEKKQKIRTDLRVLQRELPEGLNLNDFNFTDEELNN